MTRERRLQWALVLNLGIVVLQAVFGVVAHSLGLLADAGHNLTDVAAVALSLYAVHLTRRPPDDRRSFGYHRSTILAAQANAAAILVVTALLTYEGIRRLVHPSHVDAGIVIVVAAAGAVINLLAAAALHGDAHDLNMRSALLHMLSDAATSVGVVISGIVIAATGGWERLDPAVSIGIGLVIGWRAVQLLKATTVVLLEATPAGLSPTDVSLAITAVAGVESVHDLHTWSLNSELQALSAHLVLAGNPTLDTAQAICRDVRETVRREFGVDHATLQAEVRHCRPDGNGDCVLSPVVTDAG